jgi:hypothetical protein
MRAEFWWTPASLDDFTTKSAFTKINETLFGNKSRGWQINEALVKYLFNKFDPKQRGQAVLEDIPF